MGLSPNQAIFITYTKTTSQMKKLLVALCLIISINTIFAQVKFDALTLTPQMPKAGQTVNFKFNKKLSPLIDEKKVDILVCCSK